MSAAVGTLIFFTGIVAGVRRSWSLWVTFLLAGALFLPAREGLAVAWAGCDLDLSATLLATAALNVPHLFLFGVLTAIALRVRRPGGRPLPVTAIVLLVVAFGALLELEQGLFATGHCRARDLLPDALGLVVVLGGHALVQRHRRRGLVTG
jgi:VanZ family protein